MRRAPVALSVVLAGLALVLGILLLRAPTAVVTPSPSPSPTESLAPSPAGTTSATTSPSPSPSPSPTPLGLYVSKELGFALTLPPPWRKAGCGNSDPGKDEPPLSEQFTSAPIAEEHIGHAGNSNDRVLVQVLANPQGESPMAFAQRIHPNDPTAPVTFAGRPAVEVRPSTFGEDQLFYYLADGDRMYGVGDWPMTAATPDLATMQQILRSFRLLSDVERQALPDATPIPAAAPTAQALAERLKAAFEQKDIAALERLLGPCVSQAVQPGGGAAEPRERFVAELRQQLAAGVTVTVDASVVHTDTSGPPGSAYVWSQWTAFPPGGGAPPQSPQPQTFDVQLRFGKAQSGFYWSGTLLVHR